MPDAIYTTSRDDVLDAVVNRHYGHTQARIVERVLAANPGLAAHGPLLPRGLRIRLPEITAPAPQGQRKSVIKLWD